MSKRLPAFIITAILVGLVYGLIWALGLFWPRTEQNVTFFPVKHKYLVQTSVTNNANVIYMDDLFIETDNLDSVKRARMELANYYSNYIFTH